LFGAAISLGLNYAWEIAQVPFFSSMAGTPLPDHALRCLGSAAGDVLLAGAAYVLAAAAARSLAWAGRERWLAPASAWVAIGLAAAVTVEKVAIANGRWIYGPSMPTVLGVGLMPLLQWIVVPTATLVLLRARLRRETLAATQPSTGGPGPQKYRR
jgi:hypothetical protein